MVFLMTLVTIERSRACLSRYSREYTFTSYFLYLHRYTWLQSFRNGLRAADGGLSASSNQGDLSGWMPELYFPTVNQSAGCPPTDPSLIFWLINQEEAHETTRPREVICRYCFAHPHSRSDELHIRAGEVNKRENKSSIFISNTTEVDVHHTKGGQLQGTDDTCN